MFDHLSITASDLDRAQRFYDAILAPLGVPRVNRRDREMIEHYALTGARASGPHS